MSLDLHQFSQALRNDALTPAQKHASFVSFKSYFDQLCVDILKKTVFTDDQLAQHIFKQKWPEKHEEMIYKKLLFAAKNTLQRYAELVTETNFLKYQFVLRMLAFDLFGLVQYGEKKYRNTDLKFDMGTRGEQDAREVFDVAEGMLHIGTIDPETAYLREVVPVSIFLLRQSIEVFGKRALGFYSITDTEDNRPRGISTQVAWDFFKAETLRPSPRIKLQASVDTIKKVEEWTNRYVHTGIIPEVFLIENAIHFVKALIYPMNRVRDYRGFIRSRGTTQIKEYNAVKKDFQTFISPAGSTRFPMRHWIRVLIWLRFRKKPKQIVVNWMHVDNVDATILSL